METLYLAVLGLLLALPAYYTDHELPEARAARLETVAYAIASATAEATCSFDYAVEGCQPTFKGSRAELAAALVTLGFWESRFAAHIHAGACLPGECDEVVLRAPSGQVMRRYFRARSMWQLHYDAGIRSVWSALVGTNLDATRNAAWAASIKWSRCWPTTPERAFRCYAGTRNPAWSGAAPRARFYQAQLAALTSDEDGT